MKSSEKILLTGKPGIGKTTVIKDLAERLRDLNPTGFYTEEMREKGVRTGFMIKRLDGSPAGILASIYIKSQERVGRYHVDIEVFEGFLEEIEKEITASEIILIDEIGKMECLVKRFVNLINTLFSSSRILVATIAEKGSAFIESIKKRNDALIIEITEKNRDKIPPEVEKKIRKTIEGKW